MLTDTQISAYRRKLLQELSELSESEARGAEDRGTVVLDQQSVGRLSRMDALQRKAMAEAHQRRRAIRCQRIDATLKRIDEGEFGFCIDCGEDIPVVRLDLDPTVPLCVSCANG